MNIPRFLQLYKEGKLDEAFESVILDNPLPASTGRVCQHPCDNRCRRHSVDEAVNMREVHRLIADSVFLSDRFDEMAARVAARKMAGTGKKIAVVGAGPTGLTAAFYLSLFGHQVKIYESHAEAGGMLRFALPEYRLPKAVLSKEIELIRRLGVQFEFNKNVGTDISLNDLGLDYDAVFLSIGTWKEAWVYLPGTELKGVMPALLFLEGIAKESSVPLGQRVAIIGGGNAAIDSARTALRRGATVTVIYRRERKDMPAIQEEVEAAEQEGAHFVFLATPHRIVGENGAVRGIEVLKTRLGEFDSSGRRRPISTEEIQSYKCDMVILAVGEAVDRDFCRASGLSIKENGTLVYDRYTLETSREKFYAGGDLISGASNVSNAMGYGKKAARFIDQRLMEDVRTQEFLPHFEYDQKPPEHVSESRRHHPHPLPAKQRVKDFEEAILPLTAEEAVEEASRCLRCDIKENGTVVGHR
jgi:NADPH-dependent glutamate synthase beta subunit-like oxidoreductase